MLVPRSLLSLILALTLVVGITLPAALPVVARQATPVPEAGAEQVYTDPTGAYTVPIPVNWEVTEGDGFAHFTDPEGAINIYTAVMPGSDAMAAIEAGWELVSPGTERTVQESFDAPTSSGVDQNVFVSYDDGVESGQIVQALAQVVGETTYILLVEADVATAARRQAQINVLVGGHEITELEEVELAGVAPGKLTPELLAELATYINEQMPLHEVPGAAIAVVQDGEVVYRQGFGVKELGSEDPVTPETLMMIGSTTKPMTTMMMATLVDDGLMDWDTPAIEILPGFAVADPELSEQITIRELVCACTGVPRRDMELFFNANDLTAEDVIASLATFEFFTPIGEAFQYSNQMVAAGGFIATLAAGGTLGNLDEDYAALMAERIFGPIGMLNTTVSIEEATANPDHAIPHSLGPELELEPQSVEIEAVVGPVAPAGAAWSNVDDMARFMMTQMENGVAPDGNRVVSEENLLETRQPQVAVGPETSYGLGWFVDSYKGQPLIHHGGNTIGFTADFAFMPEAGIGIVTLTNGQGLNLFTEAVRARLLELAFDQEFETDEVIAFSLEQTEEALAEYGASIGPAPEEATVAPFLGTYVNPALGEITLSWDGERLVLDGGEFSGEIRTATGEVGRVADYVMVEGLLMSLPINLTESDAGPVVEIVDPSMTSRYAFTLADAAATPVGAPMATPVATPLP